MLIADYMNALGHTLPGTPQMNTLTRNGSHRSIKSNLRPNTGNKFTFHSTLNSEFFFKKSLFGNLVKKEIFFGKIL